MNIQDEVRSTWHLGGRDVIVGDTPAMSDEAIAFMESIITKDSRVLEFGSGGSTIWFSRRARFIISFESRANWYDAVKKRLEMRSCKNVDLRLDPDYFRRSYHDVEGKFDIILNDSVIWIDGKPTLARLVCAASSYHLLNSGGYLIIDDARTNVCREARIFMNGLKWGEKIIQSKGQPAAAWRRP